MLSDEVAEARGWLAAVRGERGAAFEELSAKLTAAMAAKSAPQHGWESEGAERRRSGQGACRDRHQPSERNLEQSMEGLADEVGRVGQGLQQLHDKVRRGGLRPECVVDRLGSD